MFHFKSPPENIGIALVIALLSSLGAEIYAFRVRYFLSTSSPRPPFFIYNIPRRRVVFALVSPGCPVSKSLGVAVGMLLLSSL